MSGWLTRRRLNVPEVHAMLHAQARMLTWWADAADDPDVRKKLWSDLHASAEALSERAYGGPDIVTRLSYWVRPYDPRLDARVWRWRRPGPCRVIEL